VLHGARSGNAQRDQDIIQMGSTEIADRFDRVTEVSRSTSAIAPARPNEL
jgi:hypothetical protein